jgi:hypothetical protein
LDTRKRDVPGTYAVGDAVHPTEMPHPSGYGTYRVTELIYSTDEQGREHFEYAEASWGD